MKEKTRISSIKNNLILVLRGCKNLTESDCDLTFDLTINKYRLWNIMLMASLMMNVPWYGSENNLRHETKVLINLLANMSDSEGGEA